MNNPNNQYKYTLTNRLGLMQVEPLGEDSFEISWERQDDGELDYSKSLSANILFRNAAYQSMLRLEESQYRCELHSLLIERRCTNTGIEVWNSIFEGTMSLNNGDWDRSNCNVRIKIDKQKNASCYKDNKNKQVNILDPGIFGKYTVGLNSIAVQIEYVNFQSAQPASGGNCTHTDYFGGPGTAAQGGWKQYYYKTVYLIGNCIVDTKWAREVILVPCGNLPPGPEWVLVQDNCGTGGQKKYARPARTFSCTMTTPTNQVIYECQIVGVSNNFTGFDNGVLLSDVIQYFTTYCPGMTVVSDMFQINPTIPTTQNYVTGIASRINHLMLFQKTDVKRPAVSNNATKALIKWEDVVNLYLIPFNCRYRVEAGNILRIEHVSYWSKFLGFDLTLPKYKKFHDAFFGYTYDNNEIPVREEFLFMEASAGDFAGLPIEYTGGCVTSGEENVGKITIDYLTTDVELCLANPDSDSNKVADSGFVLMACDFDGTNYTLITEAPVLTSTGQMNNVLSWAHLQRDYYKWDRPLSSGIMNNVATQFFSTKPTKKGKQLIIPLCCDDNFDPDDRIKTQIGEGIVGNASYKLSPNTLALDILYNADDNLKTNLRPIANPDAVTTYLNTSININVLANDTDPDGNSTIQVVEILLAPTDGTAVVLPNLQIRYTPNNGYTGLDQILYRVKDDYNEASNPALIAITVNLTNQPPIAQNDTYTGYQNTLLSIPAPGLFVNDSDDQSFVLSAYNATSVSGGTVVVNADGSFTYNPANGFIGSDSFTYTIADALGLTATATVTINVRDPNQPTAIDDFYNTPQDTTLIIPAPALLANDSTLIGTLSTVAQTVTTTQGGTATIGTDGSFTYVPPAGFTGADSFPYTNDNGTLTDTATVNIGILPNIFVRLRMVDTQYNTIPLVCNGQNVNGGEMQSATFRSFFYSDAAGTIPLDVTGLNLTVNAFKTGIYFNQSGTYTINFSQLVSGFQYDLLTNYDYYHVEYGCFGSQPIVYTIETVTLSSGNYTII